MNRNHGFIFVSFGIVLVAAACGGSTATPDGGTGGSGTSSGGADSSSGSGGSSGGGSGGSSGTSGSSGGAAEAGAILPPGSTPGTGMITCAGAACAAPSVCCNGGGRAGLMCNSLTACNAAGNDSYTCTSPANCTAPALCCVTFGSMGAPDVAACQASCANGAAQICLMDSECPMGQVCRGGQAAGSITTCQPPLIPPGATPGTGMIACGTATCTAPQVCCSAGGMAGLSCSGLSACDNAGNDSYTCTGQANCTAPAICCVTFGGVGGGGNDLAVCQASCGGMNTAQVCQTNAECTGGLVCRGGGGRGGPPASISTCAPPLEGGTGMDAAPGVDSSPAETGASDAPSGG